MTARQRDLQLVIVWEQALHALERILDDAQRRFVVRDVTRVVWSVHRFRANLVRLYGTALPVGSDKERECGVGPFVVITVEDLRPRYVARRSPDGWDRANASLLAAKRRYRRWARGAYSVHTTLNTREAGKDSALLFGTPVGDLSPMTWDGSIPEVHRDLVGDPEWSSRAELERALHATVRCAFLDGDGAPGSPARLLTDDAWWAIRIADAQAATDTAIPGAALRHIVVAERPFALLVQEPRDAAITREDADRVLPPVALRANPRFSDRLATAARLRR